MKPFYTLLFFLFAVSLDAQNNSDKFTYEYSTILIDSTYNKNPDLTMEIYINSMKKMMGKELDAVIGYAERDLYSFDPQSPLSNFFTDALFDYGNQFLSKNGKGTASLSMLNFGGLRAGIPAGEITVETIFNVSPFDNAVVIILLKGDELKKVFNRFSEKRNCAFSNAKVEFQNGRMDKLLIDGNPVAPDQTYCLVTVDFLQSGGDGFLEGIKYEDVIYTNTLLRNVIINHIKEMNKEGKKVDGRIDERFVIKSTP